LTALKVEGEHAGFSEKGINALAVGDRGVAGVTVFPEVAEVGIFRQFGRDGFVPEDFPGGAIEAKQMPLELLRSVAAGAIAITGVTVLFSYYLWVIEAVVEAGSGRLTCRSSASRRSRRFSRLVMRASRSLSSW
jgi:hypothetical protein